MDAFCHPAIERITLLKSTRVGYTKCLENIIGYYVHHDPVSILVVQPTIDDAEGWSKKELQNMIDSVPELSDLISDKREAGNTIQVKNYPGGTLHIVGANSPRGFRRITVKIVLFDEVDGYPLVAGAEGDQIKLGTKRSDTFWDRKIGIGSTPTIDAFSRVTQSYNASSRGVLLLPCPDCGDRHMRLFRAPEAPIQVRGRDVPVSFLQWDKGKPETAKWVCPSCGTLIGHEHHRRMMSKCTWFGDAWSWDSENGFKFLEGFTGHIGMRLWAGYGFAAKTTPADIVAEFLEAKSNPEVLKTFVNTTLGEAWREGGDTVDETTIMRRAETYTAEVPDGVQGLFLGADVQKNRIECEIVGFNEHEESWSIDYFILPGEPIYTDVWDELADILTQTWSNAAGEQYSILHACIDEGFATSNVREFVRNAGRHVTAMKGVDGQGRPIVETDQQRVRRLRKRRRKGVKPELLGVFEAKVLHYRRLALTEPGPGYCHAPDTREAEWFAQLTAEELVQRYRHGRPYGIWIKKRERNEAQDCRLLAIAALRLFKTENLAAIKPDKPSAAVSLQRKVAKKPVRRPNNPFGSAEWNRF